MKILEVYIIIALLRVLNRVAGMSLSHTQNTYFNPPPVLFLPKQNRYFRLSETPSETILEHDAINLLIPPPGDRFVWDLFGYFEASETGEHTFSIGSTEMAVIRFGWQRKHAPLFYQLLNTDIHDFTRAPVIFLAQQGEVYPILIRLIGSGKRAPVYVTVNGVSREVRDQIVHIQPDDSAIFSSSSRKFYDDRGFRCFQYIPDEARSNEDMLTDYLPSEMVKGGIENDPIQLIRPQTISSPVIVEVIGHLKPALDGYYLVIFTDNYRRVIQIGPGHDEKQTRYTIDATWIVFNDREVDDYEISLDRRFYYPFRLVAFVNTHDFEWGLVVTDPLGNEVDLFEIAASLSLASTHQTQPMSLSARRTEEASLIENTKYEVMSLTPLNNLTNISKNTSVVNLDRSLNDNDGAFFEKKMNFSFVFQEDQITEGPSKVFSFITASVRDLEANKSESTFPTVHAAGLAVGESTVLLASEPTTTIQVRRTTSSLNLSPARNLSMNIDENTRAHEGFESSQFTFSLLEITKSSTFASLSSMSQNESGSTHKAMKHPDDHLWIIDDGPPKPRVPELLKQSHDDVRDESSLLERKTLTYNSSFKHKNSSVFSGSKNSNNSKKPQEGFRDIPNSPELIRVYSNESGSVTLIDLPYVVSDYQSSKDAREGRDLGGPAMRNETFKVTVDGVLDSSIGLRELSDPKTLSHTVDFIGGFTHCLAESPPSKADLSRDGVLDECDQTSGGNSRQMASRELDRKDVDAKYEDKQIIRNTEPYNFMNMLARNASSAKHLLGDFIRTKSYRNEPKLSRTPSAVKLCSGHNQNLHSGGIHHNRHEELPQESTTQYASEQCFRNSSSSVRITAPIANKAVVSISGYNSMSIYAVMLVCLLSYYMIF